MALSCCVKWQRFIVNKRARACACVCYLSGCDFQLKDMRGISELTQSAFEKLLWRQKRVDHV